MGKTKPQSFRCDQQIWLKAMERATSEGKTLSEVLVHFLTLYGQNELTLPSVVNTEDMSYTVDSIDNSKTECINSDYTRCIDKLKELESRLFSQSLRIDRLVPVFEKVDKMEKMLEKMISFSSEKLDLSDELETKIIEITEASIADNLMSFEERLKLILDENNQQNNVGEIKEEIESLYQLMDEQTKPQTTNDTPIFGTQAGELTTDEATKLAIKRGFPSSDTFSKTKNKFRMRFKFDNPEITIFGIKCIYTQTVSENGQVKISRSYADVESIEQ